MNGRGGRRISWLARAAAALGVLGCVALDVAACDGGDVVIGLEAPADDASSNAIRSTTPTPTSVPPLTTPDGSLPLLQPDAAGYDAYVGPCLADGACPTGSTCDYDAGVGECISETPMPGVPPPPGP